MPVVVIQMVRMHHVTSHMHLVPSPPVAWHHFNSACKVAPAASFTRGKIQRIGSIAQGVGEGRRFDEVLTCCPV